MNTYTIDEKLILDIRNYLKVKTGKFYFKHIKTTPENLTITCPFHKDGQETRPSASIRTVSDNYVTAGTFHCFTCGETMGMSQMVERILGPLYNEDEVESRFGLKTLSAHIAITRKEKRIMFKKPKVLTDNESELKRYRFYHKYLEQRGITEEVANIYDIGYDSINNHITFPLRDINRNCLGVGRRSIDRKFYSYPTGMQKPLYGVYELGKYVRYLWVVEGPFNLWSLKVWNKQGVALLGTGTDYQYKELLKIDCEGYVLALDPDEAGRKGIRRLSNTLINNKRKNIYVALLPDGKDVNDLTHEQFKQLQVVTLNEWNRLYKVEEE